MVSLTILHHSIRIKRLMAVIIAIILILATYFYMQTLLSPTLSDVGADIDSRGFTVSGSGDLEIAMAKRYAFMGEEMNVTVPYYDSTIESIIVLQASKKDSSLMDTVLFNGSGNIQIDAENIDCLQYELLEHTNLASLSFSNSNLEAFLMEGTGLLPSVVVAPHSPIAGYSTISASGTNKIFMSFSASNGSLSLTGDATYNKQLTNSAVGIIVEVYTPNHRSYSTGVLSEKNINQVYIEDWDEVEFILYRQQFDVTSNTMITSSITAYNAKGTMSYGDKTFDAKGSQDYNFNQFQGSIDITHANDQFFYRLLASGSALSINSTSITNPNLTQKEFLDVLWPLPVTVLFIAGVLITWGLNLPKAFYIIPVIGFFLLSLLWANKTGQPEWLQTFFGFLPLFASTFLLLIKGNKNSESADQ